MSLTLPNISLPANTWVEIYAASGITVGTKILLQNLGNTNVRLTTKATIPIAGDGFKRVANGQQAVNEAGSTGEWVLSPIVDGEINVSEDGS